MFFKRNKNVTDEKLSSSVEGNKMTWDELNDKANKIHFHFRFGKRSLIVSNVAVKMLSFAFICFFFGLFVSNIFSWLFFSNPIEIQAPDTIFSPKKESDVFMFDKGLTDVDEIKRQEEILERDKRRLNHLKKGQAIDSLIKNDILTPENMEKINKMYPDSICGC